MDTIEAVIAAGLDTAYTPARVHRPADLERLEREHPAWYEAVMECYYDTTTQEDLGRRAGVHQRTIHHRMRAGMMCLERWAIQRGDAPPAIVPHLGKNIARLRAQRVQARRERADTQDDAEAGNGLTERMMTMLELAYDGHTNREIGALLGVSGHAVKNRLALIYARVGFEHRPGPGGRLAALRWWHAERHHHRQVVGRVAILRTHHPLVPVDTEREERAS